VIAQQLGNGVKALFMPGGEDDEGPRMPPEDGAESGDKHLLFAVHRATEDDDGSGADFLQTDEQLPDFGLGGRGSGVELEIARHLDAALLGADADKAACIFFGLREESVHAPQHDAQQRGESPVARIRTIRNARIHNRNSRAGLARNPQKVGPELGFGNDNQPWPQQSHVTVNGKAEIEREEENILRAEAITRQLVARAGGGGDGNGVIRETLPHFLYESGYGKDFANRHCMYPNHRLAGRGQRTQMRRHHSQPVAKPLAVLPLPQQANEPVRSAEQQRNRQQQIVDDVHCSPLYSTPQALMDSRIEAARTAQWPSIFERNSCARSE